MDLFRHGWWGHKAAMVGVSTWLPWLVSPPTIQLIRLTGMVLAKAGVQTTIYSHHGRHGWCPHQPSNPVGVKCRRHEIYLKCRRHVISIDM